MKTIIFIILVSVTGCATVQPPVTETLIPVAVQCPEPPLIEFPSDPVDSIEITTPVADIVKAYRISRLQWRRLAIDLSNQLNAYRKQP